MRTWILTLALLLCTALPALAQHGHGQGSHNDAYVDPQLDVERMIQRFENESREVFALRHAIVAAAGIEPGMTVADVGAGTGAFLPDLTAAVGPQGHVFACEVSIRFVEHLRQVADAAGWDNVTSVFSSFTSATLPDASCDRILVVDSYHHFDEPAPMLASMLAALKPGGEMVVVDFDKKPGARAWIQDHLRADAATFRREIEAAGFTFVEAVALDGMEENFMHRYRRR